MHARQGGLLRDVKGVGRHRVTKDIFSFGFCHVFAEYLQGSARRQETPGSPAPPTPESFEGIACDGRSLGQENGEGPRSSEMPNSL